MESELCGESDAASDSSGADWMANCTARNMMQLYVQTPQVILERLTQEEINEWLAPRKKSKPKKSRKRKLEKNRTQNKGSRAKRKKTKSAPVAGSTSSLAEKVGDGSFNCLLAPSLWIETNTGFAAAGANTSSGIGTGCAEKVSPTTIEAGSGQVQSSPRLLKDESTTSRNNDNLPDLEIDVLRGLSSAPAEQNDKKGFSSLVQDKSTNIIDICNKILETPGNSRNERDSSVIEATVNNPAKSSQLKEINLKTFNTEARINCLKVLTTLRDIAILHAFNDTGRTLETTSVMSAGHSVLSAIGEDCSETESSVPAEEFTNSGLVDNSLEVQNFSSKHNNNLSIPIPVHFSKIKFPQIDVVSEGILSVTKESDNKPCNTVSTVKSSEVEMPNNNNVSLENRCSGGESSATKENCANSTSILAENFANTLLKTVDPSKEANSGITYSFEMILKQEKDVSDDTCPERNDQDVSSDDETCETYASRNMLVEGNNCPTLRPIAEILPKSIEKLVLPDYQHMENEDVSSDLFHNGKDSTQVINSINIFPASIFKSSSSLEVQPVDYDIAIPPNCIENVKFSESDKSTETFPSDKGELIPEPVNDINLLQEIKFSHNVMCILPNLDFGEVFASTPFIESNDAQLKEKNSFFQDMSSDQINNNGTMEISTPTTASLTVPTETECSSIQVTQNQLDIPYDLSKIVVDSVTSLAPSDKSPSTDVATLKDSEVLAGRDSPMNARASPSTVDVSASTISKPESPVSALSLDLEEQILPAKQCKYIQCKPLSILISEVPGHPGDLHIIKQRQKHTWNKVNITKEVASSQELPPAIVSTRSDDDGAKNPRLSSALQEVAIAVEVSHPVTEQIPPIPIPVEPRVGIQATSVIRALTPLETTPQSAFISPNTERISSNAEEILSNMSPPIPVLVSSTLNPDETVLQSTALPPNPANDFETTRPLVREAPVARDCSNLGKIGYIKPMGIYKEKERPLTLKKSTKRKSVLTWTVSPINDLKLKVQLLKRPTPNSRLPKRLLSSSLSDVTEKDAPLSEKVTQPDDVPSNSLRQVERGNLEASGSRSLNTQPTVIRWSPSSHRMSKDSEQAIPVAAAEISPESKRASDVVDTGKEIAPLSEEVTSALLLQPKDTAQDVQLPDEYLSLDGIRSPLSGIDNSTSWNKGNSSSEARALQAERSATLALCNLLKSSTQKNYLEHRIAHIKKALKIDFSPAAMEIGTDAGQQPDIVTAASLSHFPNEIDSNLRKTSQTESSAPMDLISFLEANPLPPSTLTVNRQPSSLVYKAKTRMGHAPLIPVIDLEQCEENMPPTLAQARQSHLFPVLSRQLTTTIGKEVNKVPPMEISAMQKPKSVVNVEELESCGASSCSSLDIGQTPAKTTVMQQNADTRCSTPNTRRKLLEQEFFMNAIEVIKKMSTGRSNKIKEAYDVFVKSLQSFENQSKSLRSKIAARRGEPIERINPLLCDLKTCESRIKELKSLINWQLKLSGSELANSTATPIAASATGNDTWQLTPQGQSVSAANSSEGNASRGLPHSIADSSEATVSQKNQESRSINSSALSRILTHPDNLNPVSLPKANSVNSLVQVFSQAHNTVHLSPSYNARKPHLASSTVAKPPSQFHPNNQNSTSLSGSYQGQNINPNVRTEPPTYLESLNYKTLSNNNQVNNPHLRDSLSHVFLKPGPPNVTVGSFAQSNAHFPNSGNPVCSTSTGVNSDYTRTQNLNVNTCSSYSLPNNGNPVCSTSTGVNSDYTRTQNLNVNTCSSYSLPNNTMRNAVVDHAGVKQHAAFVVMKTMPENCIIRNVPKPNYSVSMPSTLNVYRDNLDSQKHQVSSQLTRGEANYSSLSNQLINTNYQYVSKPGSQTVSQYSQSISVNHFNTQLNSTNPTRYLSNQAVQPLSLQQQTYPQMGPAPYQVPTNAQVTRISYNQHNSQPPNVCVTNQIFSRSTYSSVVHQSQINSQNSGQSAGVTATQQDMQPAPYSRALQGISQNCSTSTSVGIQSAADNRLEQAEKCLQDPPKCIVVPSTRNQPVISMPVASQHPSPLEQHQTQRRDSLIPACQTEPRHTSHNVPGQPLVDRQSVDSGISCDDQAVVQEEFYEDELKCNVCGKEAVTMCSGCMERFFCSEECQTRDWLSVHYRECEVSVDQQTN